MALDLDRIQAMAPDQASLDAARKLLKPGVWPTLAANGAGLVWGEAQGSGATPYRVVIAEADAGYKCTCPSRKFPCKHSLALMWLRADGKIAVTSDPAPDWVADWLRRRRGPSSKPDSGNRPDANAEKPSVAAALAEAEPEAPPDPKAEARAAAQRERNRQERETGILAGLDQLDLWLSDQIDRGVTAFIPNAAALCRQIAQRLVDAKAPGLATRLDTLPTRLFAVAEPEQPLAAVEELAVVHLIAEAYRHQADLAPELRADVRQMIGWTVTRETLLAAPETIRASGRWHVIAARSEVQPDRLRRIESWLWREGPDDAPRFALLLDFVPVAAGTSTGGFRPGDRFEGELAYFGAAVPLRALIARQTTPTGHQPALPPFDGMALTAAFAEYQALLARRPWLGDWPLTFRDARVRRAGSVLYLCDPADPRCALPLPSGQTTAALPLVGVGRIDGVGLWDGRRLHLCQAETDLGRWVES